ncbi:reverse transcriptase domain-containing protein [Tanacetum coccineum]
MPSVSPFPPTIKRAARMSVLPIEPNLVERARISAINLDDYQLDHITPLPSPSSPFLMAAFQRMIAETDPTQREEALTTYETETGLGSMPVPETVLTDAEIVLVKRKEEAQQKEGGTRKLILLCPEMVPNADRLLERYIEGLPLSIKGNVTSSKPVDLHEAIDMAQGLMYQVVQELGENSVDKRKWNGSHYNHNPNNTNNTSNLNPNKHPETARVFTTGQGHKAKDCRAPPRPINQKGPGSQGGQGSDVTCFRCGEKGHYKNKCPNNGNQGGGNQIRGNPQNHQNNQRQNQGNPKGSNQASTSTQGGRRAPGRVYNLWAKAAVKDNNVVNGTFLINNVYASVLFDMSANRSFVSYAFSKYIDVTPTTLDTNYDVELANGKSLTTNTILRGCTLNLQNHLFKIDLLPIELGSFDVVVEMDWMAEHRVEVVCYEKYIRVLYRNDMLIIQGEKRGVKSESRLEVISSIRT